ncbi:hypothetical protein [Ohtaekwangia koreensis]|uniref:Uncharacterized protein n=1 Tax=Ohtaekwangia koreensis TaxID=688867 RepID=A0A1T5IJD8_9BACT|nr:hypothetical protein [Ohtaekwangia koreensis]SKC39142.1 hypothetical protein SAMN05660236_0094 [Ohtaekwangia koreensis]
MKPITVSACVMLMSFQGIYAQRIVNITPQSVGSKIIIHYGIEDSKDDQLFEVALYCSKDKYAQELRHVSGNGVGNTVYPGTERVIIWDVLKDVDTFVGEYTFEVRAIVKSKISELNSTLVLTNRSVAVTSKDEAYPEMANSLTDYINEAKDLKDAFQFLIPQAMESRQALAKLTDAMEQYNRAFEKLNRERLTYEKYVGIFWKRDILTLEFKSLMDYALGETHSVNILTLNQKVTTINDIVNNRVKRPGEVKKELTKDIGEEVIRLDKRLQELERRTNRILYDLSQE